MTWRQAVLISALLHLGVLILFILGLPSFFSKKNELMAPLSIEVIDIGKKATAPKPKPIPKPEPQEKPKVEPQNKPASEPKSEPQPESKPEPKPEPEKKPEPLPTVKEEPKKEEVVVPEKLKKQPPKPKEEPKKVEKPKKPLEKKKKEKKKKSEDRFNSILKNLEKMKSSTEKAEKSEAEETEEEAAQAGDFGEKLTMSEMDALKRQLASCWSVPAGAKDAQNLSIKIKVWVNPDATVQDVKVVDTARYASDPFFRAAADSARRAVLSPQCSPLKLPQGKYEIWKTFEFNFNPKDML